MRLLNWFKARQRGEKRVAPKGTRGRVYAKRETEDDKMAAKAKVKLTITARKFIAAENRWVDLGELT